MLEFRGPRLLRPCRPRMAPVQRRHGSRNCPYTGRRVFQLLMMDRPLVCRPRREWTSPGRCSLPTGWPGYNGWVKLLRPLATDAALWSPGYFDQHLFVRPLHLQRAPNRWTHISGNGSRASACPASTPTQPGNRHPGWQMALDTKRNILWLFGGVCQGNNRQDMLLPAVECRSDSELLASGDSGHHSDGQQQLRHGVRPG